MVFFRGAMCGRILYPLPSTFTYGVTVYRFPSSVRNVSGVYFPRSVRSRLYPWILPARGRKARP